MPLLQNPRYESFAQARARGATLEDAYEDAGYTPGNNHASRMAMKPEVAERIAELRAENAETIDARVPAVIAALLRVVKAGEELKTAAAMKEQRVTLLEALRITVEASERRAQGAARAGAARSHKVF